MELRQVLIVLRARIGLISAALLFTVATAVIVSLLIPYSYTARTSLVIDVKPADPVVSGIMVPTQLTSAATYLATQVDIIGSQRVALKVVKLLKLAEDPFVKEQFAEANVRGPIENWLADWLLNWVKIKPGRESNVVAVEFKARDPQFAAAVANAFAQGYIETNLELRVEPARRTSAWFGEQSKVLRDALEDAQSRLSKYQRDNGIVGADERLDVETARLSELSTQLVAAQAQSYDTQNRERAARELIARGASPEEMADVLNHPIVVNLKAEISRTAAKEQDLQTQLGKSHPQVRQVQAQLAEMRQKLAAEVDMITRSVGNTNTVSKRREGEIRAALDAQRKKVLDMKRRRDEMAVLMREVDSAQKAFDAVSTRATQTSLESQINQTTISVLNPAVAPTTPSSPILVLNVGLSVVLGLILGTGIAFLLELFDRRLRSSDDVRSVVDLPYLGSFSKRPAARRLALPGFMARRLPSPARN